MTTREKTEQMEEKDKEEESRERTNPVEVDRDMKDTHSWFM